MTTNQHSYNSSKATKWVGRTVMLAIIVCIGMMLGRVATADAAYRPAPANLVAAAMRTAAPPGPSAARRAWIICRVWGARRCQAALNVAWCESSLRPWARNGQYQGVYQMGAYERARFGHHHRSVWVQSRAAFRYYRLAGWNPWECQP